MKHGKKYVEAAKQVDRMTLTNLPKPLRWLKRQQ